MAKRRRSIYRQQAKDFAALASSPERRGLIALVQQANDEYNAGVGAAHTTSRALRGAIKEATPAVAKIYSDARAGLSSVTGDYSHPAAGIAQDFSKLGPAAGSIAEAARAEADAAQRRTVEAGTAASADLVDQSTRAAEGEVFATRAAGDKRHTDIGKIAQQLLGVDQEEGLRASTEYGRLLDAAAGRGVTRRGQDKTAANNKRTTNQTERSSLRSAGIDPDTGKPIPGGSLDPKAGKKKGKWAPREEQRAAGKDFGAAKAAAVTTKKEKRTREEAKQIIMSGRPSIDLGGGVKTAAIKAVTDEDLVDAALDDQFDTYLSRRTQRRLHKRGIRVSPLGVTTYGQYRKRQRALPPYHGPVRAPGGGIGT